MVYLQSSSVFSLYAACGDVSVGKFYKRDKDLVLDKMLHTVLGNLTYPNDKDWFELNSIIFKFCVEIPNPRCASECNCI